MSTESKYYQYNPEKRNIFIETHVRRVNIILDAFMNLLHIISSHGASIAEVFLRKKFGERYITLAQSIAIFFILQFICVSIGNQPYGNFSVAPLVLFAFAYLGFSIYHRLEITKYGTTYNFQRFSLSDGELAPFWDKIIGRKIFGIKINLYHVTVIFEPLLVVLIGLFLMLISFTLLLGLVIFISGISLWARSFEKARRGREWVLDNIDKKITSEMKYDVFIGRKPKSQTKGVYLPIELPDDEETRQALYNAVSDANSFEGDIWDNDNLDEK